jgi:hypothetical protein
MKVLVTFEPEFTGEPLDAVWIIDSPPNREWFGSQVGGIDANSAVFNGESDPVNILWNVFEHHPAWSEIRVKGTELTPELVREVEPEAIVRDKDTDGFTLVRR